MKVPSQLQCDKFSFEKPWVCTNDGNALVGPKTVNGPAVRGACGRAGVPELGLQEQSLRAQTPSARLFESEAARKRTPGASKQQEPDDEPWHDAAPLVEQPELMRLNRLFKSAPLVPFVASAEPARAASIAAAANILKNEANGGWRSRWRNSRKRGTYAEREVQGPAGCPRGDLYRPTWAIRKRGGEGV